MITVDVAAEIGVALVDIVVFLVLSLWFVPRIVLLAKSRGYRGPLFELGPPAAVMLGVLGGGTVARVVGIDDVLAAGAVIAGGMVSTTTIFAAVVAVLPRRSARRPGRRSSRFPYGRAAAILRVAAIVVPAALILLGDLLVVSWSFALLFFLGRGCAQAARLADAPQLDRPDHLAADGTGVVLLRGFTEDRGLFTASDRRRAQSRPRRLLGYLTADEADFLTAEAYLGPALRQLVGPLVGLGDPSEHLPSGDHMLRYYAPDAQWRHVIADQLPAMRAIIVLDAATASLMFELQLVRALRLQTRMFLVTPPPQTGTALLRPMGRSKDGAAEWAISTRFYRVLGYALPADAPAPGTIIGFDEDGRGIVVASRAESARAYAAAIAATLENSVQSPHPFTLRQLIERASAENEAVNHLLRTEPAVREKQRFAEAILTRSAVIDGVLQLVQRSLTDAEGSRRSVARTAAVPTIQQEWLREIDPTSTSVDTDTIRLLVAAWLTGLDLTPPDAATHQG